MTAVPARSGRARSRLLPRAPALLFFLTGLAALALPLWQFRANRIVAGEGIGLFSLPPDMFGKMAAGWFAPGLIVPPLIVVLIVALILTLPRAAAWVAVLAGTTGLVAAFLLLGAGASALVPPDNRLARVSVGPGAWLLLAVFTLILTDGLARMQLSVRARAAVLLLACIGLGGLLGSGLLGDLSVMREYAARRELFLQEALRHLALSFGSLALALAAGLPLGLLLYRVPRLRAGMLAVLNILQTIPSLALFGLMIPLLGWVALHLPGAAAMGIAGIGPAPALIALFLYALLPVVANVLVGLDGVPATVQEAARGIGMTEGQLLRQVQIPLAAPVLLAAVRIVLVQNIGLAVIAGLIGGGGFGTFVFQGLNQTATDLILLGALPTVALALVAGIALDLLVQRLDRTGRIG